MKKALFYGTFDPVTNGHLWLVARSFTMGLFDDIIVAVTACPAGDACFTEEERVTLWRESLQGVEVVAIGEETPIRAARRLGCRFLLRGVRSVQEYEAEVALERENLALESMVQTVFLLPRPEYADTSASIVRGMIGTPGWKDKVKFHVSVATWEGLMQKFGRAAT